MLLSLNYLVLGRTSNEVITMCIGEYSEINEELQGLTKMDIWKVELDLKSFKDTIYTEDEIKKIGTMMESAYVHKEYFNDDQKSKPNYIHIFIVPTDTSTEVKDISDDIVKELVKPPRRLIFPSSVGKNEDSFHGFWDDIIKNTILTLGKGIVSLAIMAFNRNINKKTLAGKKKVEISTADVSKELTDKFKEWTYGDAPYLFAYYAIGQFVTFVLLTESESKNIRSIIREHVLKLNLKHLAILI
ncbi:hypothetical protein GLOIN_2v1788808 [Rhizophagus irregularis DAOM 181602=DAOM 197198]|nr:hypothetical protein GLOIN_2v1788808 [Rhizophagus irregularis DAOM 181602=DAOM 197198]